MDASGPDFKTLAHVVRDLKSYALSEGFDDLAVSNCDVSHAAPKFKSWLDKGYAGDMGYLQSRSHLRSSPELLVDGVKRVITLRMNYATARDPSMLFRCPGKHKRLKNESVGLSSRSLSQAPDLRGVRGSLC